MYNPSHFEETRLNVLHDFIRTHKFATLVTLGPEGLLANHLPMLLEEDSVLRGHLARANSQWKESRADVDALAIFQGPQAYVSPSWYPAKAEHGRVVPTWNYMVVHAYGPMRVVEDAQWLGAFLRRLTDGEEAAFPAPWEVDDAPANYVEGLLKAIVGVEIPIRRLEGKWKLSQNRSAADRAGVIEGMQRLTL